MAPVYFSSAGRRRSGSYGFTLVELLVVIAIIAILISILLPALNAARASAVTIQCSSNLKTIGQAFAVYASEHSGAYPAGAFRWSNPASNGPPPDDHLFHEWGTNYLGIVYPQGYALWQQFLWPYAGKTKEVFICPAHANVSDEEYPKWFATDAAGNIKDGKEFVGFNYGANKNWFGATNGIKWPRAFRSAQSTWIVTEGGFYWHAINDNWSGGTYVAGAKPAQYVPSSGLPAGRTDDAINGRHRGRVLNVLFLDGHVETMHGDEWARRSQWLPSPVRAATAEVAEFWGDYTRF